MDVTIDLKMLVLIVVAIAIVVLVIYMVQLLRKLSVTLTHTNKILEDVEVVSKIAAERSKDVDGIIGDVSESVSAVADAIKGKENTMSAVISFVKSLISLKNAATEGKTGKTAK